MLIERKATNDNDKNGNVFQSLLSLLENGLNLR